jgi:hypothetical protein
VDTADEESLSKLAVSETLCLFNQNETTGSAAYTQFGVLLSYIAEIRDFEVDHCKVVSEM